LKQHGRGGKKHPPREDQGFFLVNEDPDDGGTAGKKTSLGGTTEVFAAQKETGEKRAEGPGLIGEPLLLGTAEAEKHETRGKTVEARIGAQKAFGRFFRLQRMIVTKRHQKKSGGAIAGARKRDPKSS